MSEHLDNLIDAALDGSASVAERAELERLLASEPGARSRFVELERMFSTLRAVPRVEPPADLRDDIMRAVRLHPRSGGWREAWRSLTSRSGGLGLSYAAAAGFVFGGLVTAAATGVLPLGRQDGVPVAGSLARPSMTARERIELPAGWIELSAGRAGAGTVMVEVRGECDAAVELELRSGSLRWRSLVPPDLATVRVDMSPDRIIVHGSGTLRVGLTGDVRAASAGHVVAIARMNGVEKTVTLTP